MVELGDLTSVGPADVRRLVTGYVTNDRYDVTQEVSDHVVKVSVAFVTREKPYSESFAPLADDLERYEGIVAGGYSVAAREGKKLVGFAIVEPHEKTRTLWICEIHVAEGMRHTGIGRCIVEEIARRGRAAGYIALACEASNENAPAIAFYSTLGFAIHGIDFVAYEDTGAPDGKATFHLRRRLR